MKKFEEQKSSEISSFNLTFDRMRKKVLITRDYSKSNMGFKKTSDLIAISFDITESAANTLTAEEIALQLDVLNNEIFVVQAIDLNPNTPQLIAGAVTATNMSVSSTPATSFQDLGDTNCLAVAQLTIRCGNSGESVSFSRAAEETPMGRLDYIGIIATNNFYVQILGENNNDPRLGTGRVWGYRARADATTYAALVQSEVLSS